MAASQVKVAEQIVSNNQAFGILFVLTLIVVFYYIRQMIIDGREERIQNRTDAKEREKALMVVIDRQSEALEKNTDILESMQETQKGMQETQRGLQEGQKQMERRFEKLEGRFDNYDLSQRHFRELNIGRDKR